MQRSSCILLVSLLKYVGTDLPNLKSYMCYSLMTKVDYMYSRHTLISKQNVKKIHHRQDFYLLYNLNKMF